MSDFLSDGVPVNVFQLKMPIRRNEMSKLYYVMFFPLVFRVQYHRGHKCSLTTAKVFAMCSLRARHIHDISNPVSSNYTTHGTLLVLYMLL